MSGSLKNSMQNLKEPYKDINNAVINPLLFKIFVNFINNNIIITGEQKYGTQRRT